MLWRAYKAIEEHLAGWPDEALSVVLVLAAVALVIIAIKGPATMKAFAAAYVLLP